MSRLCLKGWSVQSRDEGGCEGCEGKEGEIISGGASVRENSMEYEGDRDRREPMKYQKECEGGKVWSIGTILR